jgi:uncharacterized protein YjbI with pentapeptide repeats
MSDQDRSPEDWVWEQIRAGKTADFHARLGRCEPKTSSDWGDERRLSTAFLRQLFYDKTYLNEIPPEGVRIVGAWFPEGLTLPGGQLSRHLRLEQSRFEKPIDLAFQTLDGSLSLVGSFVAATPRGVDLTNAKIGQLELDEATVEGALTMPSLQVGQDLMMRGSFASIDLGGGAKITGNLILNGATVNGALNMNGLQVGQSLFMQGTNEQPATFADVDLTTAKITGGLSLSGATVNGALDMNAVQVGQSLFMQGTKDRPATFADVDLVTAKITGSLILNGATVNGALDMYAVQVEQFLLMRGTKEQPATFAAVNLATAKIGQLEVDGATVEGALTMPSLQVTGKLILSGATVKGALNMNAVQVAQSLFMQGTKEQPGTFADVNLVTAKITGDLILNGATVNGALNMNGVQVGQFLLMRGTKEQPATFAAVNLTNAEIGQLELDGATVKGALNMNALQVGQALLMRGTKEQPATFAAVELVGNAKITGNLDLDGATVKGALNMNRLQVGQGLFMRGTKERPATFAAVNLATAKITDGLNLYGATVKGALNMNGLQVGQSLLMRGTKEQPATFAAVNLANAKIGQLEVDGATLASLNLSGSSIERELRLLPLTWSGDGRLILRNTHVSVLHDSDSAWPKSVTLDGFTYDRLGGVEENGDTRRSRQDRSCRWYTRWLEKDRTYSPQPYEQLAGVLRKNGDPAMAADVLYAGRERARREARDTWGLRGRQDALLRFIGMTLLKWTIGYGLGLRYFRCLIWIAVLTSIGMVILHNDATVLDTGVHPQRLDSFVYSFQKLVPLVEFEKFDQVRLGHWAKMYFYVHRTLGYVLALFLGAGLTGLTQKS